MSPHPVVHAEIRSSDPDATRAFFGELFGWRTHDVPMPNGAYTMIKTGDHTIGRDTPDGTGIPGGIGGGAGYPAHVVFYVGVPDVEAALAQAESLGGSRVMGPEKVMEDIEIGLFNDPEGHLIGVVKTPE